MRKFVTMKGLKEMSGNISQMSRGDRVVLVIGLWYGLKIIKHIEIILNQVNAIRTPPTVQPKKESWWDRKVRIFADQYRTVKEEKANDSTPGGTC